MNKLSKELRVFQDDNHHRLSDIDIMWHMQGVQRKIKNNEIMQVIAFFGSLALSGTFFIIMLAESQTNYTLTFVLVLILSIIANMKLNNKDNKLRDTVKLLKINYPEIYNRLYRQ